MRRFLQHPSALLVALGAHACAAVAQPPPLAPVRAHSVRIVGAPVALDPHDPARTRVGELTWAGGLVLSSPDTASLGGLSGIDVAADGAGFLSQTDEGGLLRGRLVFDAAGRLAGVTGATLERLVDEAGRPYQHKIDADAEDVALVPGGYAVSFEQDHRVMRYRDGGGPGVRLAVSPDMAAREPNSGLEALAWRDDRLYQGAEDGRVWRCDPVAAGSPSAPRTCASVMATSPFKGFSLTGLDACGDGFVAVYRAVDVLHGWRAVVAYLQPADAGGGGPWRARKLAELDRLLTRDNMEGIAATPLPDGSGWRLTLVSDDNFQRFQRTLLIAFDWRGPDAPSPKPAS